MAYISYISSQFLCLWTSYKNHGLDNGVFYFNCTQFLLLIESFFLLKMKQTSLLYFRGQRIWQAIILDLLPKGLGNAKKVMPLDILFFYFNNI